MKWWKTLEPVYKSLLVILGAVGLGMGLMTYAIGAKTEDTASALEVETTTNTSAHAMINRRISGLEDDIKKFGIDLRMVRCWAQHEIQGTNPAECLVVGSGGGDNGGGG